MTLPKRMKTLRIQGRRVWDTVEATEFARDSKRSARQPVLEGDGREDVNQ